VPSSPHTFQDIIAAKFWRLEQAGSPLGEHEHGTSPRLLASRKRFTYRFR